MCKVADQGHQRQLYRSHFHFELILFNVSKLSTCSFKSLIRFQVISGDLTLMNRKGK